MKYLVNERKYSLFLISILGSIIILSIPLIFNHLLHQSHLLHIVIHQIGFVLAAFMFFLALISYSKTKITRMLFLQRHLEFWHVDNQLTCIQK